MIAKKGIFMVFHGFAGYNGISKKISYQIDAFRKCGIEMELCYYDVTSSGERVWKLGQDIIHSYGTGIFAKIKRRLSYSGVSTRLITEKPDFIYIRSMHNANPFTIKMIRHIKQAGIVTLMEIPTYPYDQEYIYFRMKLDLLFDKCFRNSMAKHIDRIVTFSDYDSIFGCKTIKISNGIDFSKIKMKNVINDTAFHLNLLGVAEIHYWHGFDRVINGLAEYYKDNHEYTVHFHIVGDFFGSREREEIMTPIRYNHLEQYVTLYGNKQGEELDALFDIADIGIGSLARHRSGITYIKTLKNREYAVRGIPFVYSEYDEDFEHKPYILKVPADDTPIDIEQIISFYHSLKETPQEIRDSVQDLSWIIQMSKVIKTINSF